MDRFEAMRVFVAVAEAGSFVGAADRLMLSKAMVSRQVAQLEGVLGTRLLHRTTRKLSLTTEGESFLLRSREIMAQWQEAVDDAGHRQSDAHGTLRINVPVSFGMSHLAPLWPIFMQQHPALMLDVTLSDRVIDVVEEGFDLAVRIGRLASSSLVSRRLGGCRLIACASPDYLQRYGVPRQPNDLLSHRILTYSLLASGDTWSFTSVTESVSDHSHVDVRIVPSMRSNNGDTCVQAAIAGQGIVLQPDFLVGEALARSELVEILPQWQAAALDIHAVYPTRRYLPAKVRLLVDFLVSALSSQSPLQSPHDNAPTNGHNRT